MCRFTNNVAWGLQQTQHGRDAGVTKGHPHALTLVELLIAMSISSVLLVGLCAVLDAAIGSVRSGNSYVRAAGEARQLMDRLVGEIRQADQIQVDVSDSNLQVIRPIDKREAGETYREFTYDAGSKQIMLRIFRIDGASSSYEVARDVASCRFAPITENEPGNASPITRQVKISITCRDDQSAFTLDNAASPRQLAYNHGP